MKKGTFLLLLVFAAACAGAQDGKWTLGIEAGPSLVSLRGNAIIDQYHESSLSGSAGLILQRALHGRLYFRTGVSATRKGSQLTGERIDNNGNPMGEATLRQRMLYLTVPVMGGVHLGSGRNRFFVHAGPWVSYLLQQRTKVEGGGDDLTEDNRDNYRKMDFGVAGAIGGWFPLNRKVGLSLELRDELGLANISKLPYASDAPIRTHALSLLLGVRIGL